MRRFLLLADSVEKVPLGWRPKFSRTTDAFGVRRYEGTTSFHTKTTTDRHSATTEPCSGKDVQESTFARFSVQPDFRLLQQYRHFCDMLARLCDVRLSVRAGRG
jgi:hypothetical protein